MAVSLPLSPASNESRAELRLRSLSWALLAGLSAGLLGLPAGLELALRGAGCGFFYGLLAFHLQRVDPDDGHLQAGLVGAVCGIRSLGTPTPQAWMIDQPLTQAAPEAMMELVQAWLPLWLPLIGSALLLHGAQRLLSALRP